MKQHLLAHSPVRGVDLSYSLVRYIALFLDDLIEEGLEVWPTDEGLWEWRWDNRHAQYALRGLGEAVLDAVATRYPETFDGQMPRAVSSR